VSTEAKEDESSTGSVWAAVKPRSRLAGVLKLMNRLFNFQLFSGGGKPRIPKLVGTGARLYLLKKQQQNNSKTFPLSLKSHVNRKT
jgi:hypothetical protein